MGLNDLVLRPVRPSDRARVVEMTSDIWEGHDYLSEVFDRWVSEAGSPFQAAEVDGVVVGVQRLRPFAPGLIWYEGLRVASTHRRQGIARAMLTSAIAEAREQGFAEMRLGTGSAAAVPLFEEARFKRLVDIRWWRGPRAEGGEPARIPQPSEAERLWAAVSASPGLDLYHGVAADMTGAHNLDAAELARLAGIGMLRAAPGGRAIAGLRRLWSGNISVAFIAGRGAALRDLLFALRYEADVDGVEHVTIALPRNHAAASDMNACGYDLVNAEDNAGIYSLKLSD